MFDQIKWYLINVGVKKYLPIGIMAAMGSLGALLAAHAGILQQWGVLYGSWPMTFMDGHTPSGPVILIELNTMSQAFIALLASVAAMAIRAAQHHTTGTTGLPGGKRAEDPPTQ